MPAQCAIYGRYGFAAAHRRCVVGISALGARPSRGARARAHACARGPPHPVGVRQHEQSRKHFSPHIRVRPKIYVGHEPRTTVDFPFNRKDNNNDHFVVLLQSFTPMKDANPNYLRISHPPQSTTSHEPPATHTHARAQIVSTKL